MWFVFCRQIQARNLSGLRAIGTQWATIIDGIPDIGPAPLTLAHVGCRRVMTENGSLPVTGMVTTAGASTIIIGTVGATVIFAAATDRGRGHDHEDRDNGHR